MATAPEAGSEWRHSNFREEGPQKDPRRWTRRGVALVAFLTLMLLFVDLNRDAVRCDQDCYGTFRTYDPGHAWTNYPDSWQWGAQNAIAGVAFILAMAGFVLMLASRLRLAVRLTVLSLVASAAWMIWVVSSPAIG